MAVLTGNNPKDETLDETLDTLNKSLIEIKCSIRILQEAVVAKLILFTNKDSSIEVPTKKEIKKYSNKKDE